jgi:hypothetical protein
MIQRLWCISSKLGDWYYASLWNSKRKNISFTLFNQITGAYFILHFNFWVILYRTNQLPTSPVSTVELTILFILIYCPLRYVWSIEEYTLVITYLHFTKQK